MGRPRNSKKTIAKELLLHSVQDKLQVVSSPTRSRVFWSQKAILNRSIVVLDHVLHTTVEVCCTSKPIWNRIVVNWSSIKWMQMNGDRDVVAQCKRGEQVANNAGMGMPIEELD